MLLLTLLLVAPAGTSAQAPLRFGIGPLVQAGQAGGGPAAHSCCA